LLGRNTAWQTGELIANLGFIQRSGHDKDRFVIKFPNPFNFAQLRYEQAKSASISLSVQTTNDQRIVEELFDVITTDRRNPIKYWMEIDRDRKLQRKIRHEAFWKEFWMINV
jgi:hypothetical protein